MGATSTTTGDYRAYIGTALQNTNTGIYEAGTYGVIVTNAGGVAASSNALLTVNVPRPIGSIAGKNIVVELQSAASRIITGDACRRAGRRAFRRGKEVFQPVLVAGERLGPATAVHGAVQVLVCLEQRGGHSCN